MISQNSPKEAFMKNYVKYCTTLPLTALLLCSGTGCHIEKKIAAAELSSAYTRQTTEMVTITDEFESAMADFSMTLFKKTVTKDARNDLVSPLSAATCLALVNNGANGNTRVQIETLFGMQTEELNRSLYAYTTNLYTGKNCEMNIANSIWFRENELNVQPDFLQTNADWFNAQVYAAPFNGETIKDINNWCYNKTKGKIDRILDNIEPQSMMYLINALDFDAKWAKEYERKDIEDGVFHNYDGTNTDVKMLYSEQSRLLYDDQMTGFIRPYAGNEYSFVALLPDEGVDVYEYAETLTGERWQTLFENLEYREIHARIPEFSYNMEFSLKKTLQDLGVTDMFSSAADFSKIGNTNNGTPLFCEEVRQKTVVELSRNGTKLAAVTLAGVGCASAPADPAEKVYITLDRAFLYAIVDNTHNLPLFIGLVNKL